MSSVAKAGGQQWCASTATSLSLPDCPGKVLACLFVTEKVLKQQKKPRQLCFSAPFLMTCWPPVHTIRSKGGYKGHVRGTQFPDFKEKCKNTGRLWLKIACRFPGDTYHSHLCIDVAPEHGSALLLCLQLP